MLNIMLTAMLLIGASGDKDGLSFQACVGYEPSVLYRGKEFKGFTNAPAGAYPDPSLVLYLNHTVRGKIGVEISNLIIIRAIGGFSYSDLPNTSPLVFFPSDSTGRYYCLSTNMTLSAISVGGEIGIPLKALSKSYTYNGGDIYVGSEGVWGDSYGEEHWIWYDNLNEPQNLKNFYYVSDLKGIVGHLGISFPVVSFGGFSFQMHCLLKGGVLRESAMNTYDKPEEASLRQMRILPTWGVALGLTFDYKGGK
ncbi:hypothetical protein GX441_06485 [bacterium]|nr:hypothetical protein [bacterium]